jgi:hypothetical protein
VTAGKVTRTILVVVTPLTLAVGAIGLNSKVGPDWATAEVSAANGGTTTGGDGN